MASHKRSAQARQTAAFKEQLEHIDLGDAFAREDRRRAEDATRREAALRMKACERKNRYRSRMEAEAAIAACAEHGTTGLHCYRCDYCKGWHLTSKPQRAPRDDS